MGNDRAKTPPSAPSRSSRRSLVFGAARAGAPKPACTIPSRPVTPEDRGTDAGSYTPAGPGGRPGAAEWRPGGERDRPDLASGLAGEGDGEAGRFGRDRR